VIGEFTFQHRFEEGASEGAPTLVLLHGTGGNEDDLVPLARAVGPKYAVLSPRGKVLESGMPRFFRRLAEGVFDQQDLAFRTDELASFLTDAAKRYGLDPAKLIAFGFSNGANIAASLLLRRPSVLLGAILARAMVPFVPDSKPDLTGRPVLLLSGANDPIVPRTQAEALAALLRGGRADVTLHWEEAGHGLAQSDLTAARQWLAERFPM
jgi:phospholipase/carboxylesterase